MYLRGKQIMAKENRMLSTLPLEVVQEITKSLDNHSLRNLAIASRCSASLFSPVKTAYLSRSLLQHVAAGEPAKVKALIQESPLLLVEYNPVVDDCGREFANITPLQYAIWAWDTWDMCNTILDSLPNNEEGMLIMQSLLSQIRKLKEKGITYTLNGKRYQEHQFSLQPLIDVLSVDPHSIYPDQPSDHVAKVGSVQALFPVYIRQVYLTLNSRYDHDVVQRSLRMKSGDEWCGNFPGLGISFAFLNVGNPVKKSVDESWWTGGPWEVDNLDGDYLSEWSEKRTEDLRKFELRIQNEIQHFIDNDVSMSTASSEDHSDVSIRRQLSC